MASSDLLAPRGSMDGSRRSGFMHAHDSPQFCEVRASFMQFLHAMHGDLGQFGVCVALADPSPRTPAAFSVHVTDVVCLRPNEQMVCPTAWRIIAMVADTNSGGESPPKRDLHSYAMSKRPFDWRGATHNATVSMPIDGASPKPASIGFLNLRPEARSERGNRTYHCW